MSEQKKKKRERQIAEHDAQEARAFYVYCIGEAAELAPLLQGRRPSAIEETASLELLAHEALAAVASAVPLSDYSEEALPARLADATWTATRAMRHESVVEYFARQASVIPLRFGAIYLTRARIEQLLGEREAEFRTVIERLRGREEWGINVYCDRAHLHRRVVELSDALRELTKQAADAPPGQSYLLRKKIEAMKTEETRSVIKRVAAEIETTLAVTSDDVRRLRLLKEEATEHGELVAKLAFLVARRQFESFRTVAERLAAAHAGAGFRLELTGAWPPYNFVDNRQ